MSASIVIESSMSLRHGIADVRLAIMELMHEEDGSRAGRNEPLAWNKVIDFPTACEARGDLGIRDKSCGDTTKDD